MLALRGMCSSYSSITKGYRDSHRKEKVMTITDCITELKDIKNYCTISAIPAVDYAIKLLEEKAAEDAKKAEIKEN